MYSACIFCQAALGSNDLVERFPVGRKLAFDSERGRLWVICRSCGGWNLTPLEERWEPIEACERAFRGTRVRFSTANIGLASHSSGLELVRIGRPLRPEFAAWRYGPRLQRRRRRAIVASAAGTVALAGASFGLPVALGIAGWWYFWDVIPSLWKRADGQRTVLRIPEAGVVVRRRHLRFVDWLPAKGEAPWRFEVPLVSARQAKDEEPSRAPRITLSGNEGMRLAALALNVLNRRAGKERELRDAVDWIEVCGSPFTGAEPGADPALLEDREQRRGRLERRHLTGLYTPMNRRENLADLPPYQRLAFELAANEDQERLFLTTHLWLLERHWREAEEIASISDRLLIPEGITAQLDRLKDRVG